VSHLLTCACELRRWHEQKHLFPNYPVWPTARQTDKEDLHLKARSKTVIISVFACKLKAPTNSRGSYPLARPPTTLSIRYIASLSDKTCRNLDSINSMCTYYNTVNMCIHTICAYFLAAASDKHMRLLGMGGLCSIFSTRYAIPICWNSTNYALNYAPNFPIMLKLCPLFLEGANMYVQI